MISDGADVEWVVLHGGVPHKASARSMDDHLADLSKPWNSCPSHTAGVSGMQASEMASPIICRKNALLLF